MLLADNHTCASTHRQQMDVRDFMHKKCEQMQDVDPAKCKETADQVADNIEAALQAVYDSLDEATVCAAFCPASAAPSLRWRVTNGMLVQQ